MSEHAFEIKLPIMKHALDDGGEALLHMGYARAFELLRLEVIRWAESRFFTYRRITMEIAPVPSTHQELPKNMALIVLRATVVCEE